jgi:NhaP-type Na+/H+ or K+/H+ antiporter
LVFGESIVNDAVSIVLFDTFESLDKNSNENIGILLLSALELFLVDSILSCIVGLGISSFNYSIWTNFSIIFQIYPFSWTC